MFFNIVILLIKLFSITIFYNRHICIHFVLSYDSCLLHIHFIFHLLIDMRVLQIPKKETKIRIGIFIRNAQDLFFCFVRVTLSRKEGILRFEHIVQFQLSVQTVNIFGLYTRSRSLAFALYRHVIYWITCQNTDLRSHSRYKQFKMNPIC